jgi:ferredoxin
MFRKLIIYYFTGTGNSENVAYWISQVAREQGIITASFRITDLNSLEINTPPDDALVVFISPIHGFNYPPVMLRFIMRFPKGKNRVVLFNTRAGMLLGKWITPGLSGIAFYVTSVMLLLKGYSIKGMIPVDLPSNWISLHPGLNDQTVLFLHQKNKERVMQYARSILLGKRSFKAVREIVQDLAITPIAVGYYFIGRFFLAKTFYASEHCNACALCIKSCPVKAIIIKNKRPYWTFKCESCMQCMSYCPKKAIETAHGFAMGVWLTASWVLIPLFYRLLNNYVVIHNGLLRYMLRMTVFFIIMAAIYRMVHFMMKYRIVQKIMEYSSLTRYKWWGKRYKALKNF